LIHIVLVDDDVVGGGGGKGHYPGFEKMKLHETM
jgi:hypothetical protein